MKIKSLSAVLIGAGALLALAATALLRAEGPVGPDYVRLKAGGGVSAGALKAALDPLFDADTVGETRALLVLHGGRIVAERYGAGFGPDTPLPSGSIAKSVTALLVGIMVADGRLALDSPVPVPAWQQPGDPREAITLRELLQMRSGLDQDEAHAPLIDNDALHMLVGAGDQDQLGYALARPLVDAPGTTFNFSSGNSVILGGIVTSRLTDRADPQARRNAMMDFIRARLVQPLGLTRFVPEFDAKGTLLAGSMMHMSARDYAKVGEFLRLRGRIGDRQILSARWIDIMTAPSPANAAYGCQIWVNRTGDDNPLFPGAAPSSLFAAVGERGQFVIISPRQRLTIVRLGVTRREDMPALRHALARLAGLFPAR